MKEKDTLFSRVYDDLKTRILTGQIPPGSTFPSIQRLRDEYQIGFRTARDVTRQLREDGLIEVQPRKAPVVRKDFFPIPEDSSAIKILEEKDSILDVYETIACVLPSLLMFASQKCNLEFLPHYKQAVKTIHHDLTPDEWRVMFLLCQEIFHFSGNPLISDLYTSLARYSHLSYLFQEAKTPMANLLQDAGQFIDILALQNPYEKYKRLTAALENLNHAVKKSIQLLEMQHPQIETVQKEPFQWNTSYSYSPNYRYTDIMFDLIAKITSGYYPPESFLPHEAVLAKEYDVSVSTLRKALYELRNLGYCKTLNAKGTIILKNDVECPISAHTMHNPTYKKKTLLLLYMIQFMSLVIGPSARKALPYFTDADRQLVTEKMKDSASNPADTILDIIILRLPLQSLQIILKETTEMMRCNYYFAFCGSDKKKLHTMRNQIQGIYHALMNGDQKLFAAELSTYYCKILDVARNYFVEQCQLNEAASIYTPESVWNGDFYDIK